MGKIGYGYGSEFHLLRWMGRHRERFNSKVLKALGRPSLNIEWLDFAFSAGHGQLDSEWKGLDFLKRDRRLQIAWQDFWPTEKGIHNWDAIGRLESANGSEWILVEAKAHLGEIKSNCTARSNASIAKITAAFDHVKQALGVPPEVDWTRGYYQFTNRVAALWFLQQHGIPAQLLFIYFTGDQRPSSAKPGWNHRCPRTSKEWAKALADQEAQVGLPPGHRLATRIHKLFLPVSG